MDLGLSGRVVVVTGGSSGIGAACVRRFAAEGADVAIGYRANHEDAERIRAEAAAYGVAATTFRHDLAVPPDDEMENALASLTGGTGAVDALVTCAVDWPRRPAHPPPFAEAPPEEWQATIASNVFGTMTTVGRIIPAMQRAGGGRIVMISSTMAADGQAGAVGYATAKAALTGFSRSIVAEYGPQGIVANIVMPGLTDTDRQRERRGPALLQHTVATTPTRRLTTVDDVARLVALLASPVNPNIAGEIIRVAGGA